MLFDQFRVPHSAMLSRYTKLDPDTCTLKREGHPGTVYGSLTNVRANIVMHSRLILARAVTIAVRYTSIRSSSRIEMFPPTTHQRWLSSITRPFRFEYYHFLLPPLHCIIQARRCTICTTALGRLSRKAISAL